MCRSSVLRPAAREGGFWPGLDVDLQDVLSVGREAHGFVPDEIEILLPALHADPDVERPCRQADRPLHGGVVISEDGRAERLELLLVRFEVFAQNAPAPRPDRDLTVREPMSHAHRYGG